MNRSKRKRPTLKKRKHISRKKDRKTQYRGGKMLQTQKGFGGVNCNVAINNNISQSCLNPDAIKLIKEGYNKAHPNNIINTSDPQKIISTIMKNDNFTDERQLIKYINDTTKQKQILDDNFAPNHPDSWNSNPDEWLSNEDIDEFLNDLEKKYADFNALKTTPIDFDTNVGGQCVEKELCDFSLKDNLDNGKTRFGTVFNLDKHNMPGSHWVSLFIDIKKESIIFFDSALSGVPKEIKKFVSRVQDQAKKMKLNLKFYTNKSEHQKGDTECGMYSIYFITKMLSDFESLDTFLTGKISDEEVFKLRTKYYNKSLKNY
jgi:hypothetical protein